MCTGGQTDTACLQPRIDPRSEGLGDGDRGVIGAGGFLCGGDSLKPYWWGSGWGDFHQKEGKNLC